jgi:hypothetical protein
MNPFCVETLHQPFHIIKGTWIFISNLGKVGGETMSDVFNRGYRYCVQVGLFRLYNKALEHQLQLNEFGCAAEIVRQGDYYAVHIGNYCNMDDAVMLERILRNMSFNTLLVAV